MRFETYIGDRKTPLCELQRCFTPFYRLLLIYDQGELLYDIENIAYTQGDIARVADNYGHDLLGENREHLMHQWKDVCEEGNIERVKRTIDLALSEVEQILFKYVQIPHMEHLSLDNQQNRKHEYLVELKVPVMFSETTCWYLLRLIHEYIVDRVLEDWASITYPEAQVTWLNKRQEVAENIKRASVTTNMHRHKVNPSLI